MTTGNLTPGSTGGDSVDFSANACGPLPATMVRVIAFCELCGRHYPKPPFSVSRECEACAQLQAARAEAEERDTAQFRAQSAKASAEATAAALMRRARERASYALSLKQETA